MQIFFSLFLFAFFSTTNIHSQQDPKRTICCCSTIVNQLASEWKTDSLATNGFRQSNANRFMTCRLDAIHQDSILNQLGKPSDILNTNHGKEYYYYYYDIRTKPKNFDGPMAAAGIVFLINYNSKMVVSIRECDIDL